MPGIHKSSQIRLMARITSVSGRQCPTGCDDEDLARAPSIFGLVIGMSRHRPAADVLHLEDEAAKREDRERTSRWRLSPAIGGRSNMAEPTNQPTYHATIQPTKLARFLSRHFSFLISPVPIETLVLIGPAPLETFSFFN